MTCCRINGKVVVNKIVGMKIPTGLNGKDGVGVPAGGFAGQILTKVDNVNFNTQWSDLSIGNLIGPGANIEFEGSGTADDPYIVHAIVPESDYDPQGVTTATVGGVTAGTDLGTDPIALQDLLTQFLYPYVPPVFTSFTVSPLPTTLEVGQSSPSPQTFAWVFSDITKVQANSISVYVNGGLFDNGISIVSPHVIPFTISRSTPGISTYQVGAINTQGNAFLSALYTATWYWRRYAGTNANGTLTQAQIKALVTNSLSATPNGTFALVAGDYKYFAWADSLGSPTAVTGFKDTATNLTVAMADSTDNAAYSNVQNGWSYALVSVTNVNGITTNYRVYRTKNILGGSISIQVS